MGRQNIINRFFDLFPDQQVKVIYAILDEFEKGYCISKEQKDALFEKYKNLIRAIKIDIYEIEFDVFMKKFDLLDDAVKVEMIESIFRTINYNYRAYLEKQKRIKCAASGHQFGEWVKTYRTVKSPKAYIDRQIIENYEERYEIWERTCTNCGYSETQSEKPQEQIDLENKREKEEKRKRLIRELEKLDGKKYE